MNLDDSKNRTHASTSIPGGNFEANAAARVALQILSLLKNPESVPLAADRSLLFQIAGHIEIPELPPLQPASPVITGKIFADVRQAVSKTQAQRLT